MAFSTSINFTGAFHLGSLKIFCGNGNRGRLLGQMKKTSCYLRQVVRTWSEDIMVVMTCHYKVWVKKKILKKSTWVL